MKRRLLLLLSLAASAAVALSAGHGARTGLPGVPDASRTLVRVWTVSSIGGGQAWLQKALRAYERQNPGVRTYLRAATADDLARAGDTLPDLLFFMPGDLTDASLLLPLSGETAIDEALLRCGRWRGRQAALPVCWGGYGVAVSASLDPAVPTPAPTALLGYAARTPAPDATPDPGYPLDAANQSGVPLQAPRGAALFALALLPDARPRLPDDFAALPPQEVYQRYVGGKCASAVLTSGQLTALTALAAAGKAPAFRALVPETVVTDQVWLAGVPRSDGGGAQLLAYLLGEDAQRLLRDQELHPARAGLRLYAAGVPALLDRAAARSLTAINAFVPAADVATAAEAAFRGRMTLDEALLPLI